MMSSRIIIIIGLGIIIFFIILTIDIDDDEELLYDGLPLNLLLTNQKQYDCNVTIIPCIQDSDCLSLCENSSDIDVICENRRRCKYVNDDKYCLNGGEFSWHGGLKMCACLDERFYGPRCEWKNPFQKIQTLDILKK